MFKKIEAGNKKQKGRSIKNRLELLLLVGFALFLTVSCQDVKKPEKPKNLISKEKMANVLYDAYLTNAARNINNKVLKKTGLKLDSLIYVKYNIDSLQFVESNDYYSANLKTYSEIISEVKERLVNLKTEKDSIYKIIKKKREDSLFKNNKKNLKIDTVIKNNISKTLIQPVKAN